MKKDILNINVFNGDDGIKYIRYDDMISMLNRIKEDNEERDKEIERLNNIINELEKWCIDYRENTGLDNYEAGLFDALGDVLDKIKELKGVDKEWK